MPEIQCLYFDMRVYNFYLVEKWMNRYKINYLYMEVTPNNEIKVTLEEKKQYKKFKYRYITDFIRLRMGF